MEPQAPVSVGASVRLFGRPTVERRVGPAPVVEVHPPADAGPGLRASGELGQVHALVFERPPQALDKHVVHPAALAVHRDNGKRPKDLTPDELRHLYEEAYGEELPVDVALIQAALDPEEMVASRRGLGGPQPEEVSRMLRTHREKVDASRRWLTATRTKLSNAQDALTSAFARLVGSAG